MADEKSAGAAGAGEGGPGLDLGLKGIIDTASTALAREESAAAITEQINVAEVLKQSEKNAADAAEKKEEAKPPPPVTANGTGEYEGLADKSRWKELGALCEKRLAETGDSDLEAKLWWIKSQFASKAIPLTILAPSLDNASRSLFADTAVLAGDAKLGRLAGLATSLLTDFSRHLQRDKDFELALSFLERAYRVDPTVRDALRDIVGQQVATATGNPEAFGPEHAQAVKRLSIELMLTPAVKEKIAAEPVKKQPAGNPFSGKGREIVVGLLTVALLIFAGMQLVQFGGTYLDKREVLAYDLKPALPLERPASRPAVMAPFPEPLNGLTHLDAVFYDFHNRSGGKSPAAVQPALSNPQTGSGADPVPASAVNPPAVDAPPAAAPQPQLIAGRNREKETINTTSPVIAPEFPRIAPNDDIDQDELPTIDFPPFRQGKTVRGSRSGSDGGGTAESSARRYVVIARTKVMSEPSYYAFSPADLYEGDEIQVEANLGKWLRIRTRRGNVAYVLAQDAAPANSN